jgi:hypothetical protein
MVAGMTPNSSPVATPPSSRAPSPSKSPSKRKRGTLPPIPDQELAKYAKKFHPLPQRLIFHTSLSSSSTNSPRRTVQYVPPTHAEGLRVIQPATTNPTINAPPTEESHATPQGSAGGNASYSHQQRTGDFLPYLPEIQDLLLSQESHPLVGQPCDCAPNRIRTVLCKECAAFAPTCIDCFHNAHRRNPLHWAYVWDPQTLSYEKKDSFALADDGLTMFLGHEGGACPTRAQENEKSAYSLILVHTNGVHRVRVEFCSCHRAPGHWQQLLRARLFPASIRRPETAFTFEVLRHFHIVSLQTKCSAYDFLMSIQRLTDNVTPSKISVSTYYIHTDVHPLMITVSDTLLSPCHSPLGIPCCGASRWGMARDPRHLHLQCPEDELQSLLPCMP